MPDSYIEVPDVRQPNHFYCGAAAAMCVGRYYGVGPLSLGAWGKALHTDVEQSTHPQAIIDYLSSLGCHVEAQAGMTLVDLRACWELGYPVICPVQDYGPWTSSEARFEYGHYLTIIGIAYGYVVCQDSSEDNVIADSGSSQAPGRIIIDQDDFLALWHDKDIDGNHYVRFGITVGPPPGWQGPGLVDNSGLTYGDAPRKSNLQLQIGRPDPFAKSYPCYAKALGREGIKDLWLRAHGEQENSIAAAVDTFFRKMVATFEERLKHPTEAGVRAAFDPKEWAPKLKEAVQPALRKAVEAGAVAEWQLFRPRTVSACTLLLYKLAQAERKEPGKPGLNPLLTRIDLPQNVQDAIDQYTEDLLDKPYWAGMMETTRQHVTDAVNEGVKEGLTGDELTQSILDAMGTEGSEARAKATARSESTGAMNLGHETVRKELAEEGLVVGKTWNALDDASTREEHAEADEQQVGVDEKFNVGGEEADFPGDPDLSAWNRVNCRCLAQSVPADDEALGIGGEPKSGQFAFANWLKERGSFFADCPRDEHGHCLPAGSATVASRAELKKVQAQARAKAAACPKPTDAEIASANEKMDRLGADDYEMQIRGKSSDRAASRKKLVKEFSQDGGHTCPCCYCGLKLTHETVTRDKIYTARQGGRYRHSNLLAACLSCNKKRGDTPFEKVQWDK